MKNRIGGIILILTMAMKRQKSRHNNTKNEQLKEELFSHTSINENEQSPKVGRVWPNAS